MIFSSEPGLQGYERTRLHQVMLISAVNTVSHLRPAEPNALYGCKVNLRIFSL